MTPARPSPIDSSPPSDGSPPARTRLLLAALRLFSEQGYAKTSIRAIATAAQANVAAVSYYFGDKAALYSAVFSEPLGDMHSLIPDFTQPGMSLGEALQCYFRGALAPLNQGELMRQCVRLHIREMLEPTGQWEREMEKDVRQPHEALLKLLCRHMDVATLDDDMHRLALTIAGLAFQLWSHREVVEAVRPQLLDTPEAVDVWARRMAAYALAMVTAEQALRAPAAQASLPSSPAARSPRRKRTPQ